MKRKLGFWSIVLLTINSIIGSGIFLTPGSVVTMAGTMTPLVYLAAALFAAVLAMTFASAAKYVSKAGASYAYSKTAFGPNVGFYIGITRFVDAGLAWGVMATAVVKTVLSIFGANSNSFGLVTIGFLILMVLLFIVNLFGPRIFTIINNLSTIGKLLALLTVIIAGIGLVLFTGVNHFAAVDLLKNAAGKSLITPLNLSGFVMATLAAFYAFTGFESVASGSGDMEKPEKNLPRAIPLAILIIAIIYIGVVLTAMMINPDGLVKTQEVVALVAVFSNPIIKNVILYGALISMFGINVAASFHTPRLLEAIAEERQIPQWFVKRTSKDFPLNAFVVTALIAIVLPMAFQYNMVSVIILSSISRFIQFLADPLAVITFYTGRNKEKTLPSAKKNVFTDLVIPVLALILTIFLLIKFDWVSEFSTVNVAGKSQLDIWAIVAMIVGFVVLPWLLFFLTRHERAEAKLEAGDE